MKIILEQLVIPTASILFGVMVGIMIAPCRQPSAHSPSLPQERQIHLGTPQQIP